MVPIKINNRSYYVKEKTSILEACKYVGITIPRFCFHESLSVAGNCRMCLVEIEKMPKPAASCVTLVSENLSIFLNTPVVKKARENIVEFLLLNHPLDCPICDQGGECDLQDQVKNFGNSYSRYFFLKRGVEDKNVGPLIKTIMTRCIHCTRCVRFGTEVAGVEKFGTLGRGKITEIGNYVSNFFYSEISGNVIDLCPVGALTSKPYAFQTRPWELKSIESIDLTDGLGSNIYINFKGSDIFRILPKSNKSLNGNIISDKIRFSYDSLKKNRINKFSIKLEKNSLKQTVVDEKVLLDNLKNKLSYNNLIIINEELSLENLILLKKISKKNKNINLRKINASNNSNNFYIKPLNSVKDILSKSIRNCFLISCNIRLENTILNSKIRIKSLTERMFVCGFNNKFNSVFPVKFVNLNVFSILNFISGKTSLFSNLLISFSNPLVLVNSNYFTIKNVNAIKTLFQKINNSSILIDIKSFSNSVGVDFINIKTLNSNDLNKKNLNIFCINLNDDIILRKKLYNNLKNIIWLNFCKSELAFQSNIVIPIESDFEKQGSFINLEGRTQSIAKVINNGNKKNLNFLLSYLFQNNNSGLFQNNKYLKPLFEIADNSSLFDSLNLFFLKKINSKYFMGNLTFFNYSFKSLNEDFYMNNNFTRNSITMSQCSRHLRKNSSNF